MQIDLVLVCSLDSYEVEFDSSLKIGSELVYRRLHRHCCCVTKRTETLAQNLVGKVIKQLNVTILALEIMHAIENYPEMNNQPYNVGLSDANLSKLELCAKIKEHVPQFVYLEAPVGEDPDKRDYIVSNSKIERTGFEPEWSLDRGIEELIKGYTMLRNSRFSNV